VNQLYDTRQVAEQEAIGLFDFQLAVLSYKNNLMYEAEKHIISALLKIENYTIPPYMAVDIQASQQNVILNEFQYILRAQAIYADLNLPYEFNQLGAKRFDLSEQIQEYPYEVDDYLSGRK
jgi:hypothetical protein